LHRQQRVICTINNCIISNAAAPPNVPGAGAVTRYAETNNGLLSQEPVPVSTHHIA